jgi:hypothetical protein
MPPGIAATSKPCSRITPKRLSLSARWPGIWSVADYWRTALSRISTLEFKLDHAAWDEKRRELNVVYEANLNGERKRACEIMQFDAGGLQVRGEALYGATL